MGLFGDDTQQNERLDALELHVRAVTEAVLQNQLDIAEGRITMMAVRAEINGIRSELSGTLAADDVDPVLDELNRSLGAARERLEESSQAAVDTWVTLQEGLFEAVDTLRDSVDEAAETAKKI